MKPWNEQLQDAMCHRCPTDVPAMEWWAGKLGCCERTIGEWWTGRYIPKYMTRRKLRNIFPDITIPAPARGGRTAEGFDAHLARLRREQDEILRTTGDVRVYSLAQVAESIISRERVRQIEEQGLRTLARNFARMFPMMLREWGFEADEIQAIQNLDVRPEYIQRRRKRPRAIATGACA